MFEQFYNLNTNPFRLTPDPYFCYRHPSYDQAYAYLQYALQQGEGFVMVTGRPGIGKTTLVKTFLAELGGRQVITARVAATNVEATDLLCVVANAYGINVPDNSKAGLLLRLEQFFTQQARAGNRVLLIIDEAQGLPHQALEEMRLLADLQLGSQPLLQLFLVGQEKLRELIREPHMEQFQQRVIGACHLDPLDLGETRGYIEHRLRKAGWQGDPQITGGAVLAIYQYSKGIPRHINKICNRLLLDGFMHEAHRLDKEAAMAVAAELHSEELAPLEPGTSQEIEDDYEDESILIDELAVQADAHETDTQSVNQLDTAAGEDAVEAEEGDRIVAQAAQAGTARTDWDTAGNQTAEPSFRPDRQGLSAVPPVNNSAAEDAAAPGWRRNGRPDTGLTRAATVPPAPRSNGITQASLKPKKRPWQAEIRAFLLLILQQLSAFGQWAVRSFLSLSKTARWSTVAGVLLLVFIFSGGDKEPVSDDSSAQEQLAAGGNITEAPAIPETAGKQTTPDIALVSAEPMPAPQQHPAPLPTAPEPEPITASTAVQTPPPADGTGETVTAALVEPQAEEGGSEVVIQTGGGKALPDTNVTQEPEPEASADETVVRTSPVEPVTSSPAPGSIRVEKVEKITSAEDVSATGAPRQSASAPPAEKPPAALKPAPQTVQADQQQAQEMLAHGWRSLRLDRLLIPRNNNAYHYFSLALKLDPGNMDALEGMDQIVERYATLANNALDVNDKKKAQRYITRGYRVSPDDARIKAVEARMNRPEAMEVTEPAAPVARPAQPPPADDNPDDLLKRFKAFFTQKPNEDLPPDEAVYGQ